MIPSHLPVLQELRRTPYRHTHAPRGVAAGRGNVELTESDSGKYREAIFAVSSWLHQLHRHRRRLPAANAQRRHALRLAASLERPDQRGDDPRA